MNKRLFEQAFNAVFHDENEFKNFRSLNIQQEIEEFVFKKRKIFRTSEKLKKYLRFIDRVILRYLAKDEKVVHSFIKNKSTLTAVQAHALSRFFFITDVDDFFPNIKTEDVRRVLIRDKSLIPIEDIKKYIDRIVLMTTVDDSIPVGFPTSPQLSNAFLFEFDANLKEYCINKKLIYTRYADDIIISGDTFNELSNLREVVQELLNKYASPKLKLNSKKTYITQLGNKVKILGLIIKPNGEVTIDAKYKKNIESLLHFYINDKNRYSDLLTKKMHGEKKSLSGLLHYAKSIDPQYLGKLQRKYGTYTLHTLMEDGWSER